MPRSASRFLSIAFVTALALKHGVGFAQAPAAFTDVRASTQYQNAIGTLKERKIIEGYADGSFKPTASINRAEFLKIVLEGRANDDGFTGRGCFPDVADQWFAPYVCTGLREGIIGGYPDGTFKPDQNISFVEAAKILSLAFGQEPQDGGSQWYDPYAKAIEASRAIPPTVDTLDHQVTRGEMAEMLWRLTDAKTDQPTKGLLNIKHPEIGVNLASEDVQRAGSCADLAALAAETAVNQYGYGGGFTGGMANDVVLMRDAAGMAGAPAPSAPADFARGEESAQKTTDGDYSETNIQVAGVDEADIVKTDGEYVYAVRQGKVVIVRVQPANQMEQLATIDLTSDKDAEQSMTISELFLDGNRLIVLGSSYRTFPYPGQPMPTDPMPMMKRMAYPGWYPPTYSVPRAEVRIYDVTNRKVPKLTRSVSFDGSTVSSRRIENRLYLVLQQGMPYWYGPVPLVGTKTEAQLLPNFRDSKSGDKDMAVAPCSKVAILPRIPQMNYLIIASIPTDNDEMVKREVILGGGEHVYASLESLYIAQTEWQYLWNARSPQSIERTRVYRFSLDDGTVAFQAQGTVPGHIKNQFSMDEHDRALRIATTTSQTWDETQRPSMNNLYILDRDMKKLGAIEGIAPGETIYSTRFLGDRAYMVTFQKIDPFFVIDVADPRNPKILGKLKIPGYSDYLHPYDEDHVIGFGKEAVESKQGDPSSPLGTGFAWYQGMKVAIFDVSDVENPEEMFKTVIGDRGTDSPLLQNHKALLFDKERNLLAFPITVSEIAENQKNQPDDGSAYGSPVFQGAYVYDISLQHGLKLKGTISHIDDPDTFKKAGQYWYGNGRDVQRILRVNDSLITVSDASMRSHELEDVSLEGKVELTPAIDAPTWELYME